MPTLQPDSVMRFGGLSSGCCAITLTQPHSPAGSCLIHYATVPDLWISLRRRPQTGDAQYEMPVFDAPRARSLLLA